MIENGISILIPTWKNFKYLQACIKSLYFNSVFDNHEILIAWQEPQKEEIEYIEFVSEYLTTHNISKINLKIYQYDKNLGVPEALNKLYNYSEKDIIGYFNDDMISLPEWDKEINDFSKNVNWDVLASTMIEPFGNNECCIIADYGKDLENFRYSELLEDIDKIKNKSRNIIGTTWPPNFIKRKTWESINGYSEEYGIGFGSDPDLIKKCYDIGCRNFIGVGRSLVYHFGSKTSYQFKEQNSLGEETFFNKFKITINDFCNKTLKRGKEYVY